MTWIHVSVPRTGTVGDCVALTRDENFQGNAISNVMQTRVINIQVDDPIESLLHLIQPVYEAGGDVVRHKFRGRINLAAHFAGPELANLLNPQRAVAPITRGRVPRAAFTERT